MEKDVDILWSYIAKLITDIEDECDRLGGWCELTDMVAKIMTDTSRLDDSSLMFFGPYQYLFRLKYRLKCMDEKKPFNVVKETIRTQGPEDVEYFIVENYDYKMFVYANKNKFNELLDNNRFFIRKSELTPAQISAFNKKIEQ